MTEYIINTLVFLFITAVDICIAKAKFNLTVTFFKDRVIVYASVPVFTDIENKRTDTTFYLLMNL